MADQQAIRKAVDRRFSRLRGQLFTLTEASLPEPQQEAFKRQIKSITQTAWRGVVYDAGLALIVDTEPGILVVVETEAEAATENLVEILAAEASKEGQHE